MTSPIQSPLKCLITGFGPFPGMPVNSSELLVRELIRLQPEQFDKYSVRMEVLPTEWELSLLLLDELYAEFRPDLTIHFGVSSNSHGFQLEQCARNEYSTKPDAAGLFHADENKSSCKTTRMSKSIDTERLIELLLESKIPAYVSTDAGNYICNCVYFYSLGIIETEEKSRHALFIHIPPLSGNCKPEQSLPGSDMTLEQLSTGAIKTVADILEQIEIQKDSALT